MRLNFCSASGNPCVERQAIPFQGNELSLIARDVSTIPTKTGGLAINSR